jgi:hypothetical protein
MVGPNRLATIAPIGIGQHETARANARLIAAAPSLLSAAEALVAAITNPNKDTAGAKLLAMGAVKNARTTIAAARGVR